jgi:hypothetical protein
MFLHSIYESRRARHRDLEEPERRTGEISV